ncbi:thiol-disulfide oxidoreductase ResA [Bacillus badius]|uniref:thiol-disulfide oxidoreductase ResA n=1 Tax=Bacillus badius TaxID=1455 RepID=UPI002E241407|nr:thiol-disulfide oxidoreductase ResA [Bacillus badius]MED0666657.1 thiol-disulfide oxidoreductase ResA [Bacillus badius]
MNKKKRLKFRIIVLSVLFLAVGFTLYQNLKSTEHLKVGEKAPNFLLESINGKEIKLSDVKGKLVLINFWGSWCEPCKREMPLIEKTYKNYKDQGFEVLSVNMRESDLIVSNYIKQNGITFNVFQDSSGEVSNAYNVYNLPATFLVNDDGKILAKHEGEIKKEQMDAWIKKYLSD